MVLCDDQVIVHGACANVFGMKVAEQLRELERIASELKIRVSYEPMGGLVSGSGGLCRVRGEYRVIIDRRIKPSERISLLADALSRFETDEIEMPTAARNLLGGGAVRRSA